MGFRSNSTLKRQLGTWHGRATGCTSRATTLERALKGSPVSARPSLWWHGPCQASGVGSGLETFLAWKFLHRIFIFSAPNIILDPFLLESSLKPFLFSQESIFSQIRS